MTDIAGITGITSGLDNSFNFQFKVMNSYSNEINNINNKKNLRIIIKIFLSMQDLIWLVKLWKKDLVQEF